jgi:hypothetical protein
MSDTLPARAGADSADEQQREFPTLATDRGDTSAEPISRRPG